MLYEHIKLDEDETIIRIVRKHWWFLIMEVLRSLLMAVLPALLYFIFVHLLTATDIFDGSQLAAVLNAKSDLITASYIMWLLILLMSFANAWTNYYLDLWAITSHRVVLVDQRGFFRRFVSSFRLERLQDMNIEVNGIIATLLDFGTIEAQTAGGSNEKFISHNMPHPRDIKAAIVEAADTLNEQNNARNAALQTQGL